MKTSSPDTLKVRIVFANRVTEPDQPEAVCVWDEFQLDGSPQAYAEDRAKMLEEVMGDDLLRYVEVDVEVDVSQVRALLNGRIELTGVVSAEPVAN